MAHTPPRDRCRPIRWRRSVRGTHRRGAGRLPHRRASRRDGPDRRAPTTRRRRGPRDGPPHARSRCPPLIAGGPGGGRLHGCCSSSRAPSFAVRRSASPHRPSRGARIIGRLRWRFKGERCIIEVVRQVCGLALCVAPVFLAACSGGHHSVEGVSDRAALRPAQFAIRPDISDPHCNRGRGLRLVARLGGTPLVAAGAMDNGSTLIAVSEYATKNTVDLYGVSRSCAPVRGFGRTGKQRITPSSRPPAHTEVETLPDAFWINAVTPRHGGALIAGGYGGRWVVGAVTRRGRLDPAFGHGGWAVLPFPGAVTAVRQAPSGRIVVGGDSPRWAGRQSSRLAATLNGGSAKTDARS